jgi:predicted alpha/beta superfamily hydrolase
MSKPTAEKPVETEVSPLMRPGARTCMKMLAPISVAAAGFDWLFEVQVALPVTYDVRPDHRYPVLWVTDGPYYLPLVVGLLNCIAAAQHVPEMIVVSVGSAPDVGIMEAGRRRGSDFCPPGTSMFYSGLAGERLKALAQGMPATPQLADRFLTFLVDALRPRLAAEYRMADDHGLFGHSGGGMFAGWALFERPDAFAKYIIGSPSINAVERKVFRMEEAYAATHTDLPVSVFLGAGELEITGADMLAAWGIVSSPVLLAETLKLRNYPSLKLHARVFSGKDHLTVVPDILLEGLLALWRKSAAA